jgi:hypothetical protein
MSGVTGKATLTALKVSNAKPGAKSYKLFDGSGLFLLVTPSGGKWWRLKYRFAGKEKQLSLGVYPQIGLKEVRAKRDLFRAMLAGGTDPSEHVKAERAIQVAPVAATRFTLDSDGALSFRLASRRLSLTPAETLELRTFLDATRAVIPKETPCP